MVQNIGEIKISLFTYKTWENFILKPKSSCDIINYFPVSDYGETYYERKKLEEKTFNEIARAIFKTFSITTIDGEIKIKDIDELCDSSIKTVGMHYILEIHEKDGDSGDCPSIF
jgi:hypothetical protein